MAPEKTLGFLEHTRVLVIFEIARAALHERSQLGHESPVEFLSDRMNFRVLRKHKLARVEDLGDQPFADLPDLLVKNRIGAQARTRGPVTSRIGRVFFEERLGSHRLALALGHLLAVGIEDPARNHRVVPRDRILVERRLGDGVERPGANDVMGLGPNIGGEQLGVPVRVEAPVGTDLRRHRTGEPGIENVRISGETTRLTPLLLFVARRNIDRRIDGKGRPRSAMIASS